MVVKQDSPWVQHLLCSNSSFCLLPNLVVKYPIATSHASIFCTLLSGAVMRGLELTLDEKDNYSHLQNVQLSFNYRDLYVFSWKQEHPFIKIKKHTIQIMQTPKGRRGQHVHQTE